MDEEYHLHLTDIGLETAENIYEKHCFFAGVDPKISEVYACRMSISSVKNLLKERRLDRWRFFHVESGRKTLF